MSKIMMHSGRVIDFNDFKKSDVCLEDIAHHLSSINRFGGGLNHSTHYSVAQHSVILAMYALINYDTKIARCCLLHDAAEAYLGDVITPLKNLLPDFKKIEELFQFKIYCKYLIFEKVLDHGHRDAQTLGDLDRCLFLTEFLHFFPNRADFIKQENPYLQPLVLDEGMAIYNERQMYDGWSADLFLFWCDKLGIYD